MSQWCRLRWSCRNAIQKKEKKMSTVYVLEPPTRGKVAVKTTHGPLDVELWPKEAPMAIRNFVRLCLESYCDNTVFHRIIMASLSRTAIPVAPARSSSGGKSTRNVQLSVRDAVNSKKEESPKDSEAGNLASLDYSDDDDADFEERMRMPNPRQSC